MRAYAPYLVIIAIFSIANITAVKDFLAKEPWTYLVRLAGAGRHATPRATRSRHDVQAQLAARGRHPDDHRRHHHRVILQGVARARRCKAYGATYVELRSAIITVMAVLALAYVMNLSGQTASLGAWLAGAGGAFAILSPILGWIGVAVTGSDTSSNALFGALQVQTAAKAGLDPVLMAAANSSGGVLGKMISPQNLAIAAAAVGMAGREGEIFRKVIGWSLLLLVLMCVIVGLQATPVLGWMVPVRTSDDRDVPPRAGSVQSVDRALTLLEALAQAGAPVGVGELAERTGLPQGTAHRLLQGLQQRGYVRHDASRKYSVGTAALRLGDAAQRSLARSARPYLAELVEASGETANLAVLEGDDVVYVAQVPSPHTLRMFAEVGRHVPPHSTAVGKVLLAAMPRERAVAVLRRTGLPRGRRRRSPPSTTFDARARPVAEQGWAADEEEQETGVRCVAVPVGGTGQVVAALSLSGPAERFGGGRDPELVATMQRVSRAFSLG